MTNENRTLGFFNITTPVVLRFADLFVPRAYKNPKTGKEQGSPTYSAELVLSVDNEELKAMKEKAVFIARARWPEKPLSELAFPFKSGDSEADKRKAKGKDDSEWLRGQVLIRAKTYNQPALAVIENGKIVDLETEVAMHAAKNKFYQGVKVLAQLNFVAYDPIGEQAKGGVKAYLNTLISTNTGERRSGRTSASDVFKNYRGGVSTEDPIGDDSLDDVMGV